MLIYQAIEIYQNKEANQKRKATNSKRKKALIWRRLDTEKEGSNWKSK